MASPLTPQKIAASGSESSTQRAILHACSLYIRPTYPLIDLIYHVPNGGARGANELDAKITGNNMKLLGTKAGVPDLCLPIPRCGYAALYIEVKAKKNTAKKRTAGRLAAEQNSFIKMLVEAGNIVGIVDDWETGFDLINDYLHYTTAAFRLKYGDGLFDPTNKS